MGRKSSARTRGGAEGSEPAPADATGQRNIFRAAKAVAAVAARRSAMMGRGAPSSGSLALCLLALLALLCSTDARRAPSRAERRASGLVYGGGGASCSWAAASKLTRTVWPGGVAYRPYKIPLLSLPQLAGVAVVGGIAGAVCGRDIVDRPDALGRATRAVVAPLAAIPGKLQPAGGRRRRRRRRGGGGDDGESKFVPGAAPSRQAQQRRPQLTQAEAAELEMLRARAQQHAARPHWDKD